MLTSVFHCEHGEAKRNFGTRSDSSVDIKDNVYTSKVLRDIWTLIRFMIHNFIKTVPYTYQKVAQKSRIEASPIHGV